MKAETIVDEALNKTLSYWGRLSGCPIVQVGGASLLISDIRHPSFNYFFGFQSLNESDLDAGVKLLDKKQKPCALIILNRLLNDENLEVLRVRGFHFLDKVVGVCRPLALEIEKTDPPANLEIRMVSDAATFDQWDDIAANVFDHRLHSMQRFLKRYVESRYEGPLKLLLAMWGGEAVGTALVYMADGVGNLMWDGVLTRYRRQGINTSMILRRLQIAQQFGCHHAVAQCFKTSLGIYKKLGFDSVCEYTWFIR